MHKSRIPRPFFGVIVLLLLSLLGPEARLVADDRPDWRAHLERGKEKARTREWDAAAAAFAEAIRLAPRELAPRIARGNALGELGRFSEARLEFARAAEVDPDNPEPLYRVALARIAEGDDAGYRLACGQLLKRFGGSENPGVASPLAYTGVARPKALDSPDPLVRWAERAVPLFRGNERVLGAALYRAGRFDEAVRRLDESARLTTPVAWDWLFLAMSNHRLGHAEEARRYIAKARGWIAAAESGRLEKSAPNRTRTSWHSWNERAEVRALLGEAEATLAAGRES